MASLNRRTFLAGTAAATVAMASRGRARAADANDTVVLAPGVVLVSAAHPSTAGLPAMFGPVSVEKLASEDSGAAGAATELSGQPA